MSASKSKPTVDLQQIVDVIPQTVTVLETIVVIDHNPDLLDRARRELPGVVVVPNLRDRGASGARNSGVAASSRPHTTTVGLTRPVSRAARSKLPVAELVRVQGC